MSWQPRTAFGICGHDLGLRIARNMLRTENSRHGQADPLELRKDSATLNPKSPEPPESSKTENLSPELEP